MPRVHRVHMPGADRPPPAEVIPRRRRASGVCRCRVPAIHIDHRRESHHDHPHHHRSRLRRGSRPEAHLRIVRRAPRTLRLHRHLRTRPSAGRRGRVPHRRARPRAGTRGQHDPLPGRQLRLVVPLGGRRRPGRGAAGPAGSRLALDRAEHVRSRRVHGLVHQGRRRADDGDQPRHEGHRRGDRHPRVLQRSRRNGALGAAARQRQRRALPDRHVVSGQRDGRPLAGRPHVGPRVRPDRGEGGAGHADGRREP